MILDGTDGTDGSAYEKMGLANASHPFGLPPLGFFRVLTTMPLPSKPEQVPIYPLSWNCRFCCVKKLKAGLYYLHTTLTAYDIDLGKKMQMELNNG